MHLTFVIFIWWLDFASSNNPFLLILNRFWWLHLFFVLISIFELLADNHLKDLRSCFKLVITLLYILVFLQGWIAHVKYNRTDYILSVYDGAQFLVLIEMVIFMSSFFVVIITLFIASCINMKQLKKKKFDSINTDLERMTQPDQASASQK
jgi:hypothetical protein